MDELDRKLARLALAKAIKTPLKSEVDAEPWSKSIIFNQPFLKDLHEQKQKTRHASSSSTNSSQSSTSVKRKPNNKLTTTHTILPSDSEDEEEDEFTSSSEDSIPETRTQSLKNNSNTFVQPKKKMPMRPALKLDVNKTTRPKSIESTRYESSPSRGSSSSFSSPVTEEDEDMYQQLPRKPSVVMMEPTTMDPMYFQRLQQLQFQHYQQQQMYLLSQNNGVFFPPRTDYTKRRSQQQRRSHPKVSQTDLRRRAEMLRSSSEYPMNYYYYRRSSYH